jgi:hypothetical protein
MEPLSTTDGVHVGVISVESWLTVSTNMHIHIPFSLEFPLRCVLYRNAYRCPSKDMQSTVTHTCNTGNQEVGLLGSQLEASPCKKLARPHLNKYAECGGMCLSF